MFRDIRSAWKFARVLGVAIALSLAGSSAPGGQIALPGQWYDTDKTNDGTPCAGGDELRGMYWNYWADLDGNGDFTYGEPWIEYLEEDTNQNGRLDPGEIWPPHRLGDRDASCWAAVAANMIQYAGGGNQYIGWLYHGQWTTDPGKMWYDGGRVTDVLIAENFPWVNHEMTAGVWTFNAPAWIESTLADGLPVGIGLFHWDDLQADPQTGGTHVINVYAIDRNSLTITLADNSSDLAGTDYTTLSYELDGTNHMIMPDYRSANHGAAYINDVTTFETTSWRGSGIVGGDTDWHDPANWSRGSVPDASDPKQFPRVEFLQGGLVEIDAAAQAQMLIVRGALTSIEISPGGSLILGNLNFAEGQLAIRGQATVHRADVQSGTIVVDGGVLDVGKDLDAWYGNVTCAGEMIVRNDGTLSIANDLRMTTTATLTIEDASSAVSIAGDFDANGTVAVGAGTSLGVGNILRAGIGVAGAATINMTDAVLDVDNQMVLGVQGPATVTSTRSTLNVATFLSIGSANEGTLNLNGGQAGTMYLTLGDESRGEGHLFLATSHAIGPEVALAGTETLDPMMVVGNEGIGEVVHNAGTVGPADPDGDQLTVALGYAPQGEGTYRLTHGEVSAYDVVVGRAGTGQFTQDGGLVTVARRLTVADLGGAGGAYAMNEGAVDTDELHVGAAGVGTVTQNGGLVEVGSRLNMGTWASGDGTYVLSGGALKVSEISRGAGKSRLDVDGGVLDLTGGSMAVGALNVGNAVGAVGELTLTGKSLTTDQMRLGVGGGGTFTMIGGTADCGQTTVGAGGTGTFVQSSGSHDVTGDLVLGDGAGAGGTYRYNGGVLNVGGDVRVGVNGGAGEFEIAGPTVQGAGGVFRLSTPGSSLTGWGRIDMPVVHDAGTITAHSGLLALKQGYQGKGSVAVSPGGELGIEADASVAGQIVCSGHVRVVGGTTKVSGGISGGQTGLLTVDSGARLDVGSAINEIHTLAVAGEVRHQAGSAKVVAAVELDGMYALSAGADLTSARTEVDGRFYHTGGTHESPEVWIGALAGAALYAIDAGTLTVADLHVGRSFADGKAPGTLRITDAGAEVVVTGAMTIHQLGRVEAVPGAEVRMTGSAFDNHSTDADAVAGLSRLELVFQGGRVVVDPLEVGGADRGAVPAGFDRNFALGALTVGGDVTEMIGQVRLADARDNQPTSPDPEALYVKNLTVGPNSLLNLNGLHLYTLAANIDSRAVMTGGTITQVAMAAIAGAPEGLIVTPMYDPSGTTGMGVGGLGGAAMLGGTTTLEPAEVDAAVAASTDGFLTLTTYYLADELVDLGIAEDTLRPTWWDGSGWVLGGTTTAGAPGAGVFAGINVDPAAYGMGYFGLNTVDNRLWNHVTHASTYGTAGVPEPSALVLLTTGTLLARLRRRRS